MAEKFSVLIKYKYLEYIKNANLSAADSWFLMEGIIEYDRNDKVPVFNNPILTALFAIIKTDLDSNREKWEESIKAKSEAGKKGGAPQGNQNARKNKQKLPEQTDACYDSEKQEKQAKQAKQPDLDLDLEFVCDSDNVNVLSGSDEPPDKKPASKQKSDKPKKPPLREREPANDMERVEKAYLQNWDLLYSQGRVKTPDPIVTWEQTRKLLKTHFEKLKPEQIIQAVNNGLKDYRVMNAGYSLGMMLSASFLNQLINGNVSVPQQKHRIAADNVSHEEVSKYFREAK